MISSCPPPINFDAAIQKIIKEEWGYLISTLYKFLNDFDLAEDALQDAVETALLKWRTDGLPKSPKGWLLLSAKRKAIDRIRRDANFKNKRADYELLFAAKDEPHEDQFTVPDERLRLIFTCCHPALDSGVSIALTLRLLGGLSTFAIAKAFLVSKETMAQRLVRGKRKIKQAAIPYVVPEKDQFPQRLSAVLSVLYLIFNEGYSASSGEKHVRGELCNEAIRLARVLRDLCPKEPEVLALLALMLLHNSRKLSRFDSSGKFVALDDQDRSRWNQQMITEGEALLQSALKVGVTGPYQVQAAISAVHAHARDFQKTNWQEIVLLYDRLYQLTPSPVVELNRIVARSNLTSADTEISALNKLENELEKYQPFYAVKADFLSRMGRNDEAISYFDRAITLSGNETEKEFLRNKITRIKSLQSG